MGMKELEERVKSMGIAIGHLQEANRAMELRLQEGNTAFKELHDQYNELASTFEADHLLLEELREKVEGRNKSAAVKRNMTDDDARRVLQGDLADKDHKEAAEVLGLTYAQVYSCRGSYTFKHVHRELEKAGWKSKWEKGA